MIKKKIFHTLIGFAFIVFFIHGNASAQDNGKLTGYITLDQNEITFRTSEACQATVLANGPSRTVCEIDRKLGGQPGFAYNCGARVFTEVFGYYANNGYINFMPTGVLPGGDVPDYSPQTLALFNLAGVEYTTYGDYSPYYMCHNCETDQIAYFDYTQSKRMYLTTKIAEYFTATGYSASVIEVPSPGYDEIKAEIIAGRPVALGINDCNHWITVIGYNDSGPNLTALVGHENFTSITRCSYLNTGPGVYEVEFPYSSLPVSGNTAIFIIPGSSWIVTPSAGENGTISPSTPQTVNNNSTAIFTVTPIFGYTAIMTGTCGGTLIGNTYTTNSVTGNCTVIATFTQNAVNGQCGSANGSTLTSAPTTNLCTAGTPGSVSGSGPWTWNCVGSNGGSTAGCSANIQTWTVTPSAGSYGTISPNIPQTVKHGSTKVFTVTPNTGYTATVTGTCGGMPTSGSSTFNYTTNPIIASCTVIVTYDTPVVTILATDPTATEAGLTTGTMTVYRTGNTASSLTVYYTGGGTAKAGIDRAYLPGSVTIPAGASSAAITITPYADSIAEGDETVVLTLRSNTAYAIGSPSAATVTIIDDNTVTKPVVTILATDPTATEAGPTTGTITVYRTGNTASSLKVYYRGGGTAKAGIDRAYLPGSVTIPAGASSADITISPFADSIAEGDETVILTLKTNTAYSIGSPASATVIISQ